MSAPATVAAVEPSAGFAEVARARLPAATVTVADAATLPFDDSTFDAVVSGLVLNFLPDPPAGVAEMARVVREDGTVAAYVWDYAGRMEFMRAFWDAAASLDETARALDEGVRFVTLTAPHALMSLWREAGLRDVRTCALDVSTRFQGFDDLWEPFLGGQGPAPAYAAGLDDEAQARLRDRLRADVPVAGDGSIELVARAWAVAGRRA